MLGGFNTNINYKGEVFHIQTEDSGLRNPVITTLLYRGGVIVASKKTSYKELLEGHIHPPKEKIRELMTAQHKEMIRELLSGRLDTIINKLLKPSDGGEVTVGGLTGGNECSPLCTSEVTVGESTKGSENSKAQLGGEATVEKKSPSPSLDDILLEYIMKKTKR